MIKSACSRKEKLCQDAREPNHIMSLKNPEIGLFDTKKDSMEENDAKMAENQTCCYFEESRYSFI